MRSRIVILVAGILIMFVAGLMLLFVQSQRAAAQRYECVNNLRIIGFLGASYVWGNGNEPHANDWTRREIIWAGTIPNPALPPEQRLSWAASTVRMFDSERQRTSHLQFDESAAWDAPPNVHPGRIRLKILLCPATNPPPADTPGVTNYVGIAGLGADAATLPLGPPIPPRAGAFRYDAPTPLALLAAHDGLSQTLLFGETHRDIGPWARGGSATVRGLDDAPTAGALIGLAAQYGGAHDSGANFAMADGSVRFFSPRTDPRILFALATIAGGPDATIVGE